MEQVYTLRPFEVHLGKTKRSHYGYHQKTGMFRVSQKAVSDKILDLPTNQQRKARKVYDWLMNSAQNRYSDHKAHSIF